MSDILKETGGFKLSIIGDEISQDLDVVLAEIVTAGFTGLELRSVWNTPPHLLRAEQVDRIARTCARQHVPVIGIDSPACKSADPYEPGEIERERRLLSGALDLARRLDAEFVRCFSFYRAGDPDPVGAARSFVQVLDGLDLDGVDLLVETGMRTNTPTIEHMMSFLDAVDDERLGILWDPGNSVYSRIGTDPFPGDWVVGRSRIRHVHVKDPDGSRQYVRLGAGDLDWDAILGRLSHDGYQGWFSLETHWRQDRILSQPARDQPWGEEFSRGGAEASRFCMAALSQLARANAIRP